MTFTRLILRTLSHYRAMNAALVLGIALATAVLTGSLLVGDSIRGSLRELAPARLGPVTNVLSSPRLIPESLGVRLQKSFGGFWNDHVTSALILHGRATDGVSAVSGVQVIGIGKVTPNYFISTPSDVWVTERGIPADHAVINDAIAERLVNPRRDGILLSIPQIDALPRDAILAQRERSSVLANLRIDHVEVTSGMHIESLFDLSPSQRTPRNAWVRLGDLQAAVEQPGKINTLLVAGKLDVRFLNQAVKDVLTLEDIGLTLSRPSAGRDSSQAVVTSDAVYFFPALEAAADKSGVPLQKINTNLLNSVQVVSPSNDAGATLHYVVASGITALDGSVLRPDEVAINQWTADRLHAKVGDRLTFTLYRRATDGTLRDISSTQLALAFKVARILPMRGLGADANLTPTYKGLTDVDSVHDWNPPEGVTIDKALVTQDDEDYWRDYRAAPKILMNYETAGRLFSSPFGHLTQIRIPATDADAFTKRFLANVDPASMGLVFQPIREQQLAAAAGSTDFSQLFIGFSFFLILAALILLGLLFRLSVEQRLPQLGLLAAAGFSAKRIRNLLLAEGLILAVTGTVLGTVGGLAYTALMIKLLTTVWLSAVGTTNLQLHASLVSLAMGGAISLVLSAAMLLVAIRRYAREKPMALLANRPEERARKTVSKIGALVVAAAFIVLGCVALAAGFGRLIRLDVACLTAGFLILVGVLLWVRRVLGRSVAVSVGRLNLARLALRNARVRPTRSMLVIALISCASFILILVGSMKQTLPVDPSIVPSGTGGYRLFLTADIPLLGDLNTAEGRKLLALKEADNPLLARAKFTNLRAWRGQDISCLNMTKPTQPTILEAPPYFPQNFVIAGRRQSRAEFSAEVLLPLQRISEIPVTADGDTAEYILHQGVGETLSINDQNGNPRKLILDTTLKDSIFQSELVMNPAFFHLLFPLQAGYSVVLIQCPAEDAEPLARLLESELDDFSVTVEPTAARLARYKDVANTYLATFQTLGGLGLLLGTIGLAIILLRSMLERRAELALLLALGFTRGRVARVILLENVLPLAAGLVIGTLTALLAVAPAARSLNLSALGMSFAAIFLSGVASLLIALWIASRHLTAASLRND